MCYNFATFVLYLDVITLIYREDRLTSSDPSLSARNNMKEADSKGQLFFIYLPARSLSDSL